MSRLNVTVIRATQGATAGLPSGCRQAASSSGLGQGTIQPGSSKPGPTPEVMGRETMDNPTTVGKPMAGLPSISGSTLGQIILGGFIPVVVSHPQALPLLCGGRS